MKIDLDDDTSRNEKIPETRGSVTLGTISSTKQLPKEEEEEKSFSKRDTKTPHRSGKQTSYTRTPSNEMKLLNYNKVKGSNTSKNMFPEISQMISATREIENAVRHHFSTMPNCDVSVSNCHTTILSSASNG